MLKQVSQTSLINFNSSYVSLETIHKRIVILKDFRFPSNTIIYVRHSATEFYTLQISVEKQLQHTNNQEALCHKFRNFRSFENNALLLMV